MSMLSRHDLIEKLYEIVKELESKGLLKKLMGHEKQKAIERMADTLIERGQNTAEFINQHKKVLGLGFLCELVKQRDASFRFDWTALLVSKEELDASPAKQKQLKDAIREMVKELSEKGHIRLEKSLEETVKDIYDKTLEHMQNASMDATATSKLVLDSLTIALIELYGEDPRAPFGVEFPVSNYKGNPYGIVDSNKELKGDQISALVEGVTAVEHVETKLEVTEENKKEEEQGLEDNWKPRSPFVMRPPKPIDTGGK